MLARKHVTRYCLFCLLLVTPHALHAAIMPRSEDTTVRSNTVSPDTTSANAVPMRQLTPRECQLAKRQCPTLSGDATAIDLDPQLLMLREQYRDSLVRLKGYIARIVDSLLHYPTASPLVTLCADMTDPDPVTPSTHTTATTDPPTSESPMATETTTSRSTAETTSLHPTTGRRKTATVASSTTSPTLATTTTMMNSIWPESTPSSTAPTTTGSETTTTLKTTLPTMQAQTAPAPATTTTTTTDQTTKDQTTTSTTTTALYATQLPTTAATTVKTSEQTAPEVPTAIITTTVPTTLSTTSTATPITEEPTIASTITTDTTPSSTTTQFTTTLVERCIVSTWGQWSGVVGFGMQVRERQVNTPGVYCPEEDYLVDKREFSNAHNMAGEDNYTNVGDNFLTGFVRRTERPRDIVLVVDVSDNMDPESFDELKEVVKAMLGLLCLGNEEDENRLSLVVFSQQAIGLNVFSDDQRPEALTSLSGQLRHLSGSACTGRALDIASLVFSGNYGSRPDVDHDTLLVTGGQSNCGEDVGASSTRLQRYSKVWALAVGVEDKPDAKAEIASLVSDLDPRRVFSLANMRDVHQMIEYVQATLVTRV